MSIRYKQFIVIWLIIISIISMAALCRTFYSDVNLTLDYIGILVGVLAILCTVLIGWQLYALIDMRKIDERFKAEEAKRNNENLRTALQIYESVATLTTQLATQATPEELVPQSIMFDLLGIVTLSKLGNYDICDSQIEEMVRTSPEGLLVKAFDKEQYIRALSEISNPNMIKKYPALVTWLATLQTLPNQ